MKNKEEHSVLTSEVKKGDIFIRGGREGAWNYETATSDSYTHDGVWSVDFGAESEFRFGWFTKDIRVKVYRPIAEYSEFFSIAIR